MQWSFWYNIEFNFSFYFSKKVFSFILHLSSYTLVLQNLLSVTFIQKLRVVHVHVSKMLVVENYFHKNNLSIF